MIIMNIIISSSNDIMIIIIIKTGLRHGARARQQHGLEASVALYYTILYYTILYYTILYYTILYFTILYYTDSRRSCASTRWVPW